MIKYSYNKVTKNTIKLYSKTTNTCLKNMELLFYFADFPIAASFPHFLNGDKALLKSITGLKPNEENHGSYLIVEPVCI